MSLVIFLDIDWDETNTQHKIMCRLLDADGVAVTIPGPFGQQQIVFEADAEAGRPPGMIHGSSIRMPLAVSLLPGIPLTPGRYEWRVEIEGNAEATATESFLVSGPAPQQPLPFSDTA